MPPKSLSMRPLVTAAAILSSVAFNAALAAEVDLQNAGCPDFPTESRFLTVHMMLSEHGTARDCVISSEPSDYCDRVSVIEEGFLCVGMTRNPRPDITLSETSGNLKNDRLIVDGEVVPDSFGKFVLRRDLATGPSGETYDVVAEQTVGTLTYALTVNVTATPDGPITLNSVRLSYVD